MCVRERGRARKSEREVFIKAVIIDLGPTFSLASGSLSCYSFFFLLSLKLNQIISPHSSSSVALSLLASHPLFSRSASPSSCPLSKLNTLGMHLSSGYKSPSCCPSVLLPPSPQRQWFTQWKKKKNNTENTSSCLLASSKHVRSTETHKVTVYWKEMQSFSIHSFLGLGTDNEGKWLNWGPKQCCFIATLQQYDEF